MPDIERVDRYTIAIGGYKVRATERQELTIRAMDEDQLRRFVHAMGGTSALLKAEGEMT
jgi:hypothetical protein